MNEGKETPGLGPGRSTKSSRALLPIDPGLVSTFLHGTGLAFRLAFMLLLLRFSSSAVLGEFGILVAIELVVIYISGFEFHTFTTRRYARRPSPGKLHICAASHRRVLFASIPLAAILTVAATDFFQLHLSASDTATFLLVITTGVVAQEAIRYLVLVGKPTIAVFATFIRGAAWQPILVPMIDSGEHMIHRIAVAWACASVLGMVCGLYVLRHSLGLNCRPRLRYLLHGLGTSRKYHAIACASVIQGNLERFVLQLLLGPAAVGAFSFFQSLSNTLPALIQASILNISLSHLLSGFGQRLKNRTEYLRRVVKRSLTVSVLISALIFVVSVPLVFITSRPEYTHLLWILPFLLIGQIFAMWTQPIHLALYGGHHDLALVVLSATTLAASLALNYTMVRLFGLTGAVLAPTVMGLALAAARWSLLRSLQSRNLL